MDFREVLSHCGLHDLGFSSLPWTYNNNQGGEANVRVRLDRVVANSDWIDRFTEVSVQHLSSSRLDHKALLLVMGSANGQEQHRRIFRYEIMWEREEGLGTIIEKAWQKCNPESDLGSVAEALKIVTKELKVWSRENFGNVAKQLESLRGELEKLEFDDPVGNRAAILSTKRELDEILYCEEMMWLQCKGLEWRG